MPIYEYRCPSCDKVVEVMHGVNDDSKRACESCGATLERLISRTSFALKGGGWYKDLYSSPKPSGGSGSSGDGGGKPDGGSTGSSKASD